MSSAAALSGGDAAAGQQGRGVTGDGGGDLLFQLADLVGELTDAPGAVAAGCRRRRWWCLGVYRVLVVCSDGVSMVLLRPERVSRSAGSPRDEHGFRVG
jgi:hypothetical protein